ncbi:MAG TPA: S1/P1 nuclease [Pyrinomonadaceae bacterium]|jgi:hypothetical protein
MKKLRCILTIAVVIVSLSAPAFAWGDKGHKTVGQVAQLYLDAMTRQKLAQIMKQGDTLANMSIWADQVKRRRFGANANDPDEDTQAFLRDMRNKDNRDWHFVDLPLDCQSYSACPQFQDKFDVVHVIDNCIVVLQGGTNFPNLNKRNALRMLVHLIGDMHQPLHVGVGFINEDENSNSIIIETDPAVIIARHLRGDSDIGGNKLLLSRESGNNLHSFWDGDLVYGASGGKSVAQFASELKNTATPAPVSWNGTDNNPRKWAQEWALDSLKISKRNTYNTVQIVRPVVVEEEQKYLIKVGADYSSNNTRIVQGQLAKGGYRLAQLLKAIL